MIIHMEHAAAHYDQWLSHAYPVSLWQRWWIEWEWRGPLQQHDEGDWLRIHLSHRGPLGSSSPGFPEVSGPPSLLTAQYDSSITWSNVQWVYRSAVSSSISVLFDQSGLNKSLSGKKRRSLSVKTRLLFFFNVYLIIKVKLMFRIWSFWFSF